MASKTSVPGLATPGMFSPGDVSTDAGGDGGSSIAAVARFDVTISSVPRRTGG